MTINEVLAGEARVKELVKKIKPVDTSKVVLPEWKNKLKNVHPGDILKEDFLNEMKITPYALAKAIGGDHTRISQLIKGRRSMSVDTAQRLSKYFGNSVKFWLDLQNNFDLEKEKEKAID